MVKVRERHSNRPTPVTFELSDGVKESAGGGGGLLPRLSGGGLVGVARQVFLPEGYPESVSGDYLEYQAWDTAQAFASSVSGSLATAAVLGGLGVGDSSATPLAATITWILKDGAGMVGRIVFAACTSTSLDFDCKRWRMFADVLNDCVMLVELAAPLLPRPLVLPVLCGAGVGRSLVGVAGGATKAAVAQHQARRGNMADLAAKDGSQETLVNLVALCCNLLLLPLVTAAPWPALPFLLFLLLAAAHVFANYRAVSCLVLASLNTARLHLLLDRYQLTRTVHNPATINKLEPVMRPAGPGAVHIEVGVSAREVRGAAEAAAVERMLAREEPCCAVRRGEASYLLLVSSLAAPRDIYRAYTQCYLGAADTVDTVLEEMEAAGWDLGTLALSSQGYVIQHGV